MKTKILLSVTLSLVLLTACSDSSSSVVDKTQADVTGSSLFEDTSATDESSEATTTQATTTTASSTTTTTTPSTTTTTTPSATQAVVSTPVADEPSTQNGRGGYISADDDYMEVQVFIDTSRMEPLRPQIESWMYPYCQIASELNSKQAYFEPQINHDVTIPGESDWYLVDDIRYPDMQSLKDAYLDIYTEFYCKHHIKIFKANYTPDSYGDYKEYDGRLYIYEPLVEIINGSEDIKSEILTIEKVSDSKFKVYSRKWENQLISIGFDEKYSCAIDINLSQINNQRAELYGRAFDNVYVLNSFDYISEIVLENGEWKTNVITWERY